MLALREGQEGMTWRPVDERQADREALPAVPALRIEPEPWMEHALCRSRATLRVGGRPVMDRVRRLLVERRHWAWIDRTFFPERGAWWAAQEARMVCARCPVWRDCLRYALERRERWGVWGGTTPQERQRMLRLMGRSDG